MGKEALKPTQSRDTGVKRRALYDQIDYQFDLLGPQGFHGFSCDRWAVPLGSLQLRKDTQRGNLIEED